MFLNIFCSIIILTPALLGVSGYIIVRISAFIAFFVISMKTAYPFITSSRSFEISINTRIPKHPSLLDIIDSLLNSWFALFTHFFLYSVYLGYKPEGTPSKYYYVYVFDYAIQTLETLPRHRAPLTNTHRTEHYTWCRVLNILAIRYSIYHTSARVQSVFEIRNTTYRT